MTIDVRKTQIANANELEIITATDYYIFKVITCAQNAHPTQLQTNKSPRENFGTLISKFDSVP